MREIKIETLEGDPIIQLIAQNDADRKILAEMDKNGETDSVESFADVEDDAEVDEVLG